MISDNTISYMFFMIGAANLLNLIAVWRHFAPLIEDADWF